MEKNNGEGLTPGQDIGAPFRLTEGVDGRYHTINAKGDYIDLGPISGDEMSEPLAAAEPETTIRDEAPDDKKD